jgi:hypothetical protein
MIRHSYPSQSYSHASYDDDMCLKPPLVLWLTVVYLARAIMLPLVIGVGHIAGVNAEAMTMLRGYWRVEDLAPSLLAIPVLYTMCRRSPTASAPVRWVWSHGRAFLALSASLDIALKFIPQMSNREFSDQSLLALVAAAADAYFLLYTLVAQRVRDTFLDFPPPLATATTEGTDRIRG